MGSNFFLNGHHFCFFHENFCLSRANFCWTQDTFCWFHHKKNGFDDTLSRAFCTQNNNSANERFVLRSLLSILWYLIVWRRFNWFIKMFFQHALDVIRQWCFCLFGYQFHFFVRIHFFIFPSQVQLPELLRCNVGIAHGICPRNSIKIITSNWQTEFPVVTFFLSR